MGHDNKIVGSDGHRSRQAPHVLGVWAQMQRFQYQRPILPQLPECGGSEQRARRSVHRFLRGCLQRNRNESCGQQIM